MKSSAESGRELKQLLERPLHGLDLCVILLDGKEFHDFTLIVALSQTNVTGCFI
jgi:hypothetical protein